MSLMDQDILADVVQLSPGLLGLGVGLGLSLWLFGWRWHRFWIVLATTVAAGLVGLWHGERFHAQPLVAAPLLALAAGVLALALVRLLAFLTGGIAGLLFLQSALPQWNQPLACFIISGLIGLVLFRLCWMGLTSLGGTLLLAYSGLAMGHHYQALDALLWTQQTGALLSWILGGAAGLGLAFQFLLDRRARRPNFQNRDEDEDDWDVLPGKKALRWFRRAG